MALRPSPNIPSPEGSGGKIPISRKGDEQALQGTELAL